MRVFQISVSVTALCATMVLSACGSGSDRYSKEYPSAGQSARTFNTAYQSNSFAAPSLGYQQGQAIEIRSELANLPCETLAYEDKRMTNIGQVESPTFEDMMAQLRLLEVRAALYARCNQPSAGGSVTPQFTVPIQEAMNAAQIQEVRRLHNLTLPENQIVSVAPAISIPAVGTPTFVRNTRTAPPAIETAKVVPQPQLPQLAPRTTSTTNSVNSIQIRQINTPTAQPQSQSSDARYKTIEKFGDTVRVKNVTYDDLPLIAGPELLAK